MFRVWHLCLTPVCGTRGSGLAIVLFLASAILLTRFAIWLAGGSRSGSTPTPAGRTRISGLLAAVGHGIRPAATGSGQRGPGSGLVAWSFRFSVRAGNSGRA
jgi:hypothetical protein